MDNINKFINFHLAIKGKDSEYPFLISNADRSDREETHWWGILDLDLKTEFFFFDSFEDAGLKNFIIQDDKKIVRKNLQGTEKMTRTYNKLILVTLKFSMKAFPALKLTGCKSLSETAQDFLYFVFFIW